MFSKQAKLFFLGTFPQNNQPTINLPQLQQQINHTHSNFHSNPTKKTQQEVKIKKFFTILKKKKKKHKNAHTCGGFCLGHHINGSWCGSTHICGSKTYWSTCHLGLSRTKLNLKVNVLGNVWFIQFPSLKICRHYHLFSCLIWFLFSIFKTHHSKMWEWIGRTKIGSFHTIESWVKWHSCNKTHFARTNKLVLSNLS